MGTVNDQIREAVRVEIARRASNQAQLAKRVGVSRQYLSDVMRGRAGNVPTLWQKVLDELGLELLVRPKGSTRSD